MLMLYVPICATAARERMALNASLLPRSIRQTRIVIAALRRMALTGMRNPAWTCPEFDGRYCQPVSRTAKGGREVSSRDVLARSSIKPSWVNVPIHVENGSPPSLPNANVCRLTAAW